MQRLFILNDTCLTFDKQRGIVSECKKYKVSHILCIIVTTKWSGKIFIDTQSTAEAGVHVMGNCQS